MKNAKSTNSRWRKLLRFILYSLGILFVLVAGALYALTLPAVQQRITRKAESFLQKKLGTRVEVGAIRLRFPYDVSLEHFLLEDQHGDTLAQVGRLSVAVGMWKLLDQTIEVQKIDLENARVYLNRKDSVYNFDFVVRAFASPKKTAAETVDTTASPWKLHLNMTALQLKKVDFLLLDEDAESTTQANIGTAETLLTSADMKALRFELNGFTLTDSDIRLIQTKKSPKNAKSSPSFGLLVKNGDISRTHIVYATSEMAVETSLEKSKFKSLQVRSDNDIIALQAQKIEIGNSAVAYRDPNSKSTTGHFNAGDLDLTSLNAQLPVFSFQNDTLYVQADALSGVDKSGVQLHSLRAITRVTPGSIEVKDALASLNQTNLDGDIVLYKNEQATFNRMQVHLRQVKGMMGDLLLLMPPLENPAFSRLKDMPFEVSGKLSGWLQNLQTENIRFRAGSGTLAFFTGSVQQLTVPEKLGIQLNISRLATNHADLVRWMSVGDTPMDSLLLMPLPASIDVSGYVEGNVSHLKLTLGGELRDLQTGAGFPPVNGPPLHFDVTGVLTDLNDPDKLGMDLQINDLTAPKNFFAWMASEGVQMPDLLQATGTLRGTLASLQTDLKFNAKRNDTNSHLTFKGLLQNIRTPDKLGFDVAFNGVLARQEILGYVPDTLVTNILRLPAFVQVDGQARGTVKDATGKAQIGLGTLGQIQLDGSLRDSTYQMDILAQNLRVSQLAVDSVLQPIKTVSLSAHVVGEGFQFGRTAQVQLTGKVDSIIWDNLVLRDISLNADVHGRKFSGEFISPDNRFAVQARASGDFSKAKPLLDTDITLNCVDMREFGWINRPTIVCMHILSHSEGLSEDTLNAHLTIEKIDLQYDTVHIHPGDLVLDVNLDNRHNSISIVSDWLQGEVKGYFQLAELSTTVANIVEQYFVVDRTAYVPRVSTDSLSVQLHLLQPEILVTGLIPGLTELGPVYLEGSLVGQRNYFNLRINAPRIVYRAWDVDSLNVRAFAGDSAAMFVLTTPLVKRGEQDFIENAVLNGQFLANVANVSFKASSDDGRERFRLALQALINSKTKETVVTLSPKQIIDYKEWAVNPGSEIRFAKGNLEIKQFELTGNGQSIKLAGTTHKLANNKTGLNFAVNIDRLNYENFDLFVASYVRDLKGWAEAHLDIKGTTDALQVRGKMQLHETYFTPALTNVHYQLSETPLEFTESGVILDGLTVKDPYGKILEIKGKLSTADFANIKSNISLHADRWQVLNSTRQQNPQYFGELYVSLDGTIRGPASQPDIQLALKTAKESTFTYVYDVATQALQHEGVVFFLPPPRQYVRPPVYDAPVNTVPYTLSASIEIDSNLTISSVINPVTGDDFHGRATGKLQYDQLSNGNKTLSGRVELVRGVYNYSYQSVVKRSFEVTNGSTITWTGDLLRPELDLKARYEFKASPYPLVVNQLLSASTDEKAMYRRPQRFYLQTSLYGSALQPDVNFQFIYPSGEKQDNLSSSFGNQQSGLVEGALSNVNQDKNLLSRQVFGVLLLRNFIGDEIGPTTAVGGGNPLQSGLSSFLTSQINALADQYLTFIDVDFATTEGATNNGAGQAEGSTNYQLRLQKSFFQDRLTFKLSGGTSVGGSSGDDVHSALENASVEYALTPKGELKVTVFSERGFELLNATSANLRNSGAGFILAREFGGNKK